MADVLKELIRQIVREEIAAARLPGNHAGYMSVADAARHAQVDPRTIRRWMDEGRLTRYEAGRERRVSLDELEKLMRPGGKARSKELTPEEMAERDFG